jgi:hypothetical protein
MPLAEFDQLQRIEDFSCGICAPARARLPLNFDNFDNAKPRRTAAFHSRARPLRVAGRRGERHDGKMKRAVWFALLGALLPWAGSDASADPPAPAPHAAIQPGEYVYEGGAGTLTIKAMNGKLTFAIDTVGGNAHTCGLRGTIAGLEGRTDGDDTVPPCVFHIATLPGAVTIEAQTNDACRAYCGVRAAFEGKYVRPAPECAPPAVSATRATFKRFYDAKKLQEARATLEPLLRCEDVVDRFSSAWIRNDVAVTRHALHDDLGCRKVLEPLRDLAVDDDPGAGEPAFKEELTRIAKATRFNLRLCREPDARVNKRSP